MKFACKINWEFRQTIKETNSNLNMIAKKKCYNFHSVEKIFHDFLSYNPTKWKLAKKVKVSQRMSKDLFI